jgi:hypothetical protein
MGWVSGPPDPATMMAALVGPVRLQVFAAMATRTGPGRREQFPPAPGTRTVAYLTPTGAANLTGVSVEDAYAVFRVPGPAEGGSGDPGVDRPPTQRVSAGHGQSGHSGRAGSGIMDP